MDQQTALLSALQGQNGLQNQSNVYGQLQNIASGQGPNPAQAMLNQATGANIANQASLMAGQRGSTANAGLMARQIAQQGGALQQQAVGQGATMQANQSLGALGQMGGMANQMAANQIGQTNENVGSQQALYNLEIQKQQGLNAANSPLILQNMKQGQAAVGGFLNGIGSMMGSMGGGGGAAMAAKGGMVTGYADGGSVSSAVPQSSFGKFLKGVTPANTNMLPVGADVTMAQYKGSPTSDSGMVQPTGTTTGGYAGANLGVDTTMPQIGNPLPASSSDIGAANLAAGGLVDIVVSPNEKIIPPSKTKKAAGGDIEAKTVPGKAKVSGDSYENDTVPMKVEPGTIVIPRSKAGNEKDAAAFVRNVLAKRGRK